MQQNALKRKTTIYADSVPAVFCKKKSQILRPKRKILQAEKCKFCDAFTQPNFFLCNENTADIHP